MTRKYYSQRSGKNPNNEKISLELLKELFSEIYYKYLNIEYFKEKIGYIDEFHNNFYYGKLGNEDEIRRHLFLSLRKKNLWPINKYIESYKEDDLFDIIEFCYDNISQPIYEEVSDDYLGQRYEVDHYIYDEPKSEFRDAINKHLKDYGEGFELLKTGNIVILSGYGLESIYEAKIPSNDDQNIIKPINIAIDKFRGKISTLQDRKEAVRLLADVLEYLRPKAKFVITKSDENDLFNIANNFGIRHHNDKQKTEYDERIWISWMFYHYLSTIYTILWKLRKVDIP